MVGLGVEFQNVVPSIQLGEADGSYAVSFNQEDRVDTHKNAPMTPEGRLRMVQAVMAGEPMRAAAQKAGDIDHMQAWAGQSAALSKAMPAAELVTQLWQGTLTLLGEG